ncbi:rhodanese-like domain-containing protein [Salinibaculum salinum]|uniref:rhodanese-like domain-containing protein n=1 Tax=Salinibaculum salinum TaxID=3131996 RepID=UPI0030EF9CC4
MTEIEPDRLSERLQADDEGVVVLDVRYEADFEEWHIPDSVNIDVYDKLTTKINESGRKHVDEESA